VTTPVSDVAELATRQPDGRFAELICADLGWLRQAFIALAPAASSRARLAVPARGDVGVRSGRVGVLRRPGPKCHRERGPPGVDIKLASWQRLRRVDL
jgi:hypothetical protein